MADKGGRHLVISFVAWKTVLLAVAAASPGPGYDTSTALLLHLAQPDLDDALNSPPSLPAALLQRLVRRLVRWDAFYFTANAAHGYRYEQQWAFGWGYARLVGALTQARGVASSPEAQAVTAVLLNLVSHLASVLLLYQICLQLLGRSPRGRRAAFVAALLHVFAPAGLFLCAPYGESLFSALSFLGSLLYARGLQRRTVAGDACLIAAGLAFGLSCTVRSNGVLFGVLFAIDLALALPRAFASVRGLRVCAALGAGGLLVGAGYAAPQLVAYNEYCRGEQGAVSRRSWCDQMPPSIFGFVQSHYWNVGFGRYWTLSNVPLFLLAMPMLAIMLTSSTSALIKAGKRPGQRDEWAAQTWRFAVPQLLLAVLTLTNFHVQIITRIATGYFVHYIWVATVLEQQGKITVLGRQIDLFTVIIRWMVVYGIVQGGLYASFLPPA